MKIEKIESSISFNKFISTPIFLFKLVGINLIDLNGPKSFGMHLNYWFGLVNFLALCATGIALLYQSSGNYVTFLDATATVVGLCFASMTIFKAYLIVKKANSIMNIQIMLRDIFPQTRKDQENFSVEKYQKRIVAIMAYYIGTYLILIGLFEVCALLQSTVDALLYKQSFVKILPFLGWYPYDVSNSTTEYVITYLHQVYAGYTTVTITVGSDVLMCFIVMQIVMHFNFLTKVLVEYGPGKDARKDFGFLQNFIQRHQLLLSICGDLNDIFSSSILFNFLVSSLLICLVGFQATAEVNFLDTFKYLLFLLTAISQIFFICYFGSLLMDASYGVAEGAYEQNWIDADQEYKKILLMIIMRAQKVASLRVIAFGDVSLESFKTVCGMSYQFFALLRTFYSQ